MHFSIRKSLLLVALIVLGFIGSICAGSADRLITPFTNNGQENLTFEPQAHQAHSTDVSAERMDRISAAAQRGLFSIPQGRDFTVAADAPYVPDELLVYFAPRGDGEVRSGAEKSQILSSISGGVIKRHFKTVPGLSVVTLPAGMTVEEALVSFNNTAGIVYAEPNYKIKLDADFQKIPNDPRFVELWGMHNTGQSGGTVDADIDAPEAWSYQTDANDIIVAVIDTGIDYTHPDLAANMWINEGEIGGNGLDDDGNGYVDDVYGYDFVNNDGNPRDDHFHGTHCAGTIGAVGDNGKGVAGVCWNVQIMAIKFLDAAGFGDTGNAISSVEYGVLMGADVLSNSWGGGPYSQSLKNAISAAGAAGVVFVAAAGNDFGLNNDILPHYPSSFDCKNIIAVMSTHRHDGMSVFSNYGPKSVDLGAPGSLILSCEPGNDYRYLDGTSMATPHVAGACALLKSMDLSLSVSEIKEILLETVDPTLPDLCVSGGRLNLQNMARRIHGVFIRVSATEFEFSGNEGGANPEDQILGIRSGGLKPVNWKISYQCDWLEASPTSGRSTGEPNEVTLRVDITGLTAGNYNCELTISDPCAVNSPQTVEVNLRVIGPIIELSQSQFEFIANPDTPIPDNQIFYISNSGGGTLNWEIEPNTPSPWLEIDPRQGSSMGEFNEVTLEVDASGLSVGSYHCGLIISDPCAENNPQTVAVHLAVGERIFVPEDYATIQQAINAASDYDAIIVADDTYTGAGNRDIDFMGKAITVRSANGPQNCIINCQGTNPDMHRGFYFYNGEESNSVLDGFTIINGYAGEGGGILCETSSPTIRNCIIRSNQARKNGGGIGCIFFSSPTIHNCTINNNTAAFGGGIYVYKNCKPTISYCTVNNNSVSSGGGGISINDSDPFINHCTFSGNNASYGGGIYTYFSNSLLMNACNVSDNTAVSLGGGICIYFVDYTTITNCLIGGNGAYAGGGIWNAQNDLTLSHCTLAVNAAVNGNALACDSYVSPSSLEITNSILWDGGDEIWNNDGSSITINYSDVQGGWSGMGNIDVDPNFVAGDDFHLMPESPCIDAGCDAEVYEDMEGNVRPYDCPGVDNNGTLPEFDMGAYEFVNARPVADAGEDQTVYAEPNGLAQVTLDGSGSYDPDADELTYHWSWTIDGQTFTSSGSDGIVNMLDFAVLAKQFMGVYDLADFAQAWLSTLGKSNYNLQFDTAPDSPYLTIELPVGAHVITLTVNDGIEDSEPNEVAITVLRGGDLDQDNDVDMDDLAIILAARNTPAHGPDDPRDLDGDGMITVLDARKWVVLYWVNWEDKLKEGLSAYFPLDGSAADSTGNGHDGVTTGGIVWSWPGVKNGCLSFSNGHVQIGGRRDDGVMTYHPDQDFTWALWFKPSGSNNDDEMLISRRRYHGDSDQINMSMTYYADGRVRMHFSGDHLHSGTAFSETLCNDGEWHHGAVVRDTATRKYLLYVDGELEKTLDDLGQDYSAAASCRIGQEGETYGGNRQYHGLIDDVRIYHRAFSRTEIRALYQN